MQYHTSTTTVIFHSKPENLIQLKLGNIKEVAQKEHTDRVSEKIEKEETTMNSTPRRPRNTGPITSTPKNGSIDTDIPNYTTIDADNLEESDYWTQIEDAIDKWIAELPINVNNENRNALKEQIASDILDRVQYLELVPEARKSPRAELEDLVYQVHRRVSKVVSPEEMRVAIQKGDELMKMMEEVHYTRAHDTSAEQDLHQQIMEVISNAMPQEEEENMTIEELNSFEIIKDELADAFIKIHFTGGNSYVRNKLKKKIKDELDKFCNKYLTKHPDKSFDREKLNSDLYRALKNVEISDDVFQSTALYINTKDVIENYVKELPLENLNATQILQMKHNIGEVAKMLLELEQNAQESNANQLRNDKEEIIERFMETLPLKQNQFTKQLIDILQATEVDRAIDASTRYFISPEDFKPTIDRGQVSCPYPQCSLSTDHLDYLESIRQRACMAPDCMSSLIRGRSKSHADICEGIGLQTQPCSSIHGYSQTECSRVPLTSQDFCWMDFRAPFMRRSCARVQPQVSMKDYWDESNLYEHPSAKTKLGNGNRRVWAPAISSYTSPYTGRQTCSRMPYPLTCQLPIHRDPITREIETHQPFDLCRRTDRHCFQNPECSRFHKRNRVINIGSLEQLINPIRRADRSLLNDMVDTSVSEMDGHVSDEDI